MKTLSVNHRPHFARALGPAWRESPVTGAKPARPATVVWDDLVKATLLACVAYALLGAGMNVYGALPSAPTAPSGASGSDFIDFFQGYASSAIGTIILIVGALIFVIVAWLAVEALINAVNNRGSWATVIVLGLVGAAVLVFDLVLLNQANTVLT